MIYGEYIEAPKGNKRKYHRIVRRGMKGCAVDAFLDKSAQDKRRGNLHWYRVTHGRNVVWPPIRGTQFHADYYKD